MRAFHALQQASTRLPDSSRKLKALERENRELRQANEILRIPPPKAAWV